MSFVKLGQSTKVLCLFFLFLFLYHNVLVTVSSLPTRWVRLLTPRGVCSRKAPESPDVPWKACQSSNKTTPWLSLFQAASERLKIYQISVLKVNFSTLHPSLVPSCNSWIDFRNWHDCGSRGWACPDRFQVCRETHRSLLHRPNLGGQGIWRQRRRHTHPRNERLDLPFYSRFSLLVGWVLLMLTLH